jgi:hypothetical protein
VPEIKGWGGGARPVFSCFYWGEEKKALRVGLAPTDPPFFYPIDIATDIVYPMFVVTSIDIIYILLWG